MAIRRILFASAQVRVGAFRCPPSHPEFEDSGPAQGHLLVFPRTPVLIVHEGAAPVVADPTVVMLYNRGQVYRRARLAEQGDRCDWLEFAPELLREAVARYDPAAAQEQRLLSFVQGPSDPRCHLLQRLLVDRLLAGAQLDPLQVEELLLTILGQVLGGLYRARGLRPRRERPRGAPELVHAARELLGTSFREQITLEQLAGAVYCSPFHLCRIFRSHTGRTIHQYLTQLRVRAALDQLLEGADPLAALGGEHGFGSHSHFTQAFRGVFGLPPSALRGATRQQRQQLQELSKILIADPRR